jgi:hypothetical protein
VLQKHLGVMTMIIHLQITLHSLCCFLKDSISELGVLVWWDSVIKMNNYMSVDLNSIVSSFIMNPFYSL